MKTYCPIFWSQDLGVDYSATVIHLKDILPTVGQKHSRTLIKATVYKPAKPYFLYGAPVSDLNGWSEQPSEIALSHLLKANVVDAAQTTEPSIEAIHPAHVGKRRYELEILSCERFLSVLQALQEDSTSWHLQGVGTAQKNFLTWDEVNWCGSAVVEGLTYITANTSNEAYMELIVEEVDDEIVGLFSLHIDPGGVVYDFGRKRLTGEELRVIKQALNIARPLHDSQAAYLAVCES